MITKDTIKDIPSTPGVYLFYEENTPIYIGKAVNLKARLLSHLQNSKLDQKENFIIETATRIEHRETLSEFDAILLEAELISTFKPKYNFVLKDDKSYLYIKVTVKDTYPKIFPVRRENDGKSRYFGPFESAQLTYYIIRSLRKIVPFCTQRKVTKRPCFYSKIGLCSPCPNSIEGQTEEKMRQRLRKDYRKNIQSAIKILEGRSQKTFKSFEKELREAVLRNDYEGGIILRNKLYLFQKLLFSRSFYMGRLVNSKNLDTAADDFVRFMEHNFGVSVPEGKKSSYRIECYDISNLFGKEATGSMVVFEGGHSVKDQYRRFKIKTVKKISDFDMIEEVFERRFSKKEWRLPDLIVVDGGSPQLRKVSSVLQRKGLAIPHIGLAKRPDRVVFPSVRMSPIKLQTPKPLFNLLCEIRDEAHRFAKKYHLFLRHKNLMV